tara:strand:+ start:10852 stop:11163 length:312 start_codon:yes stop_codon:yes gene_type:complete
MQIIRDGVKAPVRQYRGCLLFEYKGLSTLDVYDKHEGDQVIKLITKNNGNIQIYITPKVQLIKEVVRPTSVEIAEEPAKVDGIRPRKQTLTAKDKLKCRDEAS